MNLHVPVSWEQLNQDQLRYALTVLATFGEGVTAKTYILCRFAGIHVVKKSNTGWLCFVRLGKFFTRRKFFILHTWQIESFLSQLSYVDSYESFNVRLDDIGGARAVDVYLQELAFIDYLNAEKYYQSFLMTKDDNMMCRLAEILYRKKDGSPSTILRMEPCEILNVHLWYSFVKTEMGKRFPNFFQKIDTSTDTSFDILAATNAQIRALCDGDVTKEEQVLHVPCWRALTELDQKAKEANELNKELSKHGQTV